MKPIQESELRGFADWWHKRDNSGQALGHTVYEAIERYRPTHSDYDDTTYLWEQFEQFAKRCYIAGRRSVQSEISKKAARRRPPGR
jgi:hypothetical protein